MSDILTNPNAILFLIAFVIDIVIVIIAVPYLKKVGFSGFLSKIILFSMLSAGVFGIHHLGEVFLHESELGVTISESIEIVAALFLLVVSWQLYMFSKD